MKNLFSRLWNFSRRHRIFSAVVLVIVVTGSFLFIRNSSKKQAATPVQTQKVEKGTIVATVSASGQILTANLTDITTSAKGQIKTIFVKDGDKVTAGQKIMEIALDAEGQKAASSAYSAYLSAKNSLDSAQVTLWTLDSAMWSANRTFINDAVSRGLPDWDPTYIQEHDNWLAAEAKYKNQQAVINQAKIALNNTWLAYQETSSIISSPAPGIVTNLTYAPGMPISADSGAVRVAVIRSEGTPLASFNISEIDVAKVQPGQKATVKIDSLTDKSFTGKVLTVDRIGTTTSGITNYPVVIQIDTDAPEILPNMSATANIILAIKNDILVIPSSAIQKQGGQNVVRVKKNGQEQMVAVEIGLSSDTQTEITSGLSEGDEIITSSSVSETNQSGRSVFSTGGFGGSRMLIGR